ncbi:MAG TPA: cysteine synthase family protein [Acidimicrobiia bacterium]|nr:cysteine synthase family protein [Acidimicrobiia bacterium]
MAPSLPAPGHTPLVPLAALSPNPGISLYAKLEWHNPTGSVKDRPARWMLDAAEREGLVQPGDALVEPTSGNTGIALARLARLRGYPMTVVVPDNAGEERKALLRAFGAEVVESPGERGANGAVEVASDIAAAGGHTMLFQYANPANPQSHYEGTGPEILEQAGRVDAFVAGLGTGGTLMGVGRALRAADPATRVVAAAPPVGESVLGLRSLEDGFVPPIFDPTAIDARILVSTADAVRATRRLLAEEGLFVGLSSGAVLHAALRWAERLEEGRLVLLFADAGWKYLSSGAWEGSVEEAAARLNGRPW